MNLVGLDVLAGLVAAYLTLALATTAAAEALANLLGLRQQNLIRGLTALLATNATGAGQSDAGDPLLHRFLRTAVVTSLLPTAPRPRRFTKIRRLLQRQTWKTDDLSGLDHLEAEVFRRAIEEMMSETAPGADAATLVSRADIGAGLDRLGTHGTGGQQLAQVLRRLLAEVNAGTEADTVAAWRRLVERHYDATMAQSTSWYRAKLARWSFGVAFALAYSAHLDTFYAARVLATDDTARAAALAVAEGTADGSGEDLVAGCRNEVEGSGTGSATQPAGDVDPKLDACIERRLRERVEALEAKHVALPASMFDTTCAPHDAAANRSNPTAPPKEDPCQGSFFDILLHRLGEHGLGYLVSALAISLGAPFWFDLLSKIINFKRGLKSAGEAVKG